MFNIYIIKEEKVEEKNKSIIKVKSLIIYSFVTIALCL
jgi:hypothetical protein